MIISFTNFTKSETGYETKHEANHTKTLSRENFLKNINATEEHINLVGQILDGIQPSCSNACKLSSFSAWNHNPKKHKDEFNVPHETILCQELNMTTRCHAMDIKTGHENEYPLFPNYQTFSFPVVLLQNSSNFLKGIGEYDHHISGITWDQHVQFKKESNTIIIILSIILLLVYSASIPIFNHILKRQPISPLPKSYFEKITLENPIPEDKGSTCFTLPGKHQYFQDINYEKLISEKIRLKLINTRPLYEFRRSKTLEKEITKVGLLSKY